MQTARFRISSSLFLLIALIWQTAFATGLQSYCIGDTPDAKIHVCSSAAVTVSSLVEGCSAPTEAVPRSDEAETCSDESVCTETEAGECCADSGVGKKLCTSEHQCQLVPHHVIVDRPALLSGHLLPLAFLSFTSSDEQPSAALRTLTGDSSPPRQLVQLLRTASRRAPPQLS